MTRRQQIAVATLISISYVLIGAVFFGLGHQAGTSRAAQRQAGQQLEQKLCTTFGKLAALQPPAGDPAANPSRGYLQDQHAALVELGADLGCRR